MEIIIDIYNKILSYNKKEISYEIDIDGNIWFKFIDIINILEYKSKKDTLRDNVSENNKKMYKNIKKIKINKEQHANTIYINESGLYGLLIKSKMKKAKKFQEWIIEEILPKLRKYGKYEVDKKVKYKLDKLNEKIKELKKNNKVLKEELTKNKYP